jgi:hypothetical protein
MSEEIGSYTKVVDEDGVSHLVLTPGGSPVPPLPPIPSYAKWLENMEVFGKKWAGPLPGGATMNTWEGYAWYYDGSWVFQKIAKLLGTDEAEWLAGTDQCENAYLKNYLRRVGTTGWRVFPHGSEASYLRTNDLYYICDLLLLANKSPYGVHSIAVITNYLKGLNRTRETAYLMQVLLAAVRLNVNDGIDGLDAFVADINSQAQSGQPVKYVGDPTVRDLDGRLTALYTLAQGHIDQWFVAKTANVMQPFMAALTAHALIEYCRDFNPTVTADVIDSVRTAADWLWENAWVEKDQAFYYQSNHPYESDGTIINGAPDLNMLLVYMYGWLWKQTGEVKYLERGDMAFSGGVEGAYLNRGKQFTQHYRLSIEYAEMRKS